MEACLTNAAKLAVLMTAGILLAGAAVIALTFYVIAWVPAFLFHGSGVRPPIRAPFAPRPRR